MVVFLFLLEIRKGKIIETVAVATFGPSSRMVTIFVQNIVFFSPLFAFEESSKVKCILSVQNVLDVSWSANRVKLVIGRHCVMPIEMKYSFLISE